MREAMFVRKQIATAFLLMFALMTATTASAQMRTWDGWGSFGMMGEPKPEVSMPSCDAMEIVAEDAVGFIYHRLGERARKAARIGWEWRIDKGPEPSFLGEPKQDRPLSIHLLFESEGREGSYGPLRLRMFGFPRDAHVLTYVWGSANAPGSVVVNPYHARGRLIVLRNGFGEYGVWTSEDVDFRADFQSLFMKPPEQPAYLVVSTDVDDSDSVAIASLRGLFFEDDEGRFGPCDG